MENTTIFGLTNNKGQLIGKISEEPITKFESNGEYFYELKLIVSRLSETVDTIPVTISQNLIQSYNIKLNSGEKVAFSGEFRSRNVQENGKSHLMLSFFAKDVLNQDNLVDKDCNKICLTGYICKTPIYRVTPFERQICDILLAVNRANYNKSDYLPCIVWGRNAKFMGNMPVGTKVSIEGRIQSRNYTKQNEEGQALNKTAYEISVYKCKLESENESLEGKEEA